MMMIFMLYTTAAMALAPDYTRKRFYMIKDVIRVLGEREQKSTLYPTMRDFMPQYIKVINGFSF